MSEKLLPCPFCSNAEAECNECEVGRGATAYFVGCNESKCGAVSGYFPTPAMACAAWNRRPSPPEPTAQAVTEHMLAAAFEAGALAVHEEWKHTYNNSDEGPPRGDPEFGEAARDYAQSVLPQAGKSEAGWRNIESAPDGVQVLVYCAEDHSRWSASRGPDGLWYGMDEKSERRYGHSASDNRYVTGWALNFWRPLPAPPITSGGGDAG